MVALSQRYGHPRVLGIPIPKTLVIWASPSYITSFSSPEPLGPFVFDSWLYTNGSFILVVSPLNALMRDQIIKLDNLNVKTLIIRCGDSVSDADIQGN